jgi:hypothetical protein
MIKVNPHPPKGYCQCGQPLHYQNPDIGKMVEELIEIRGEYIEVQVARNFKTYMVSRHFIALHGLKGKDVSKMGFMEAEVLNKHLVRFKHDKPSNADIRE